MKTGKAALFMTMFALLSGFKSGKTLEVEQIILKSPKGKGEIVLGFEKGYPMLKMINEAGSSSISISLEQDTGIVQISENGNAKIVLAGGKEPELSFYQDSEIPSAKIFSTPAGSQFYLSDTSLKPSVFLQGGESPGVFLKNSTNQTVGSWSLLSDGGTVLGLGMSNGTASTVLRGGDHPNISFFSEKGDPMAALGMIKKVPHLLVSGPTENEGILIHGGQPSSMVVVDELGKVKILISKHGVFQGKKEESPSARKKEDRVFSFQDLKKLSINQED